VNNSIEGSVARTVSRCQTRAWREVGIDNWTANKLRYSVVYQDGETLRTVTLPSRRSHSATNPRFDSLHDFRKTSARVLNEAADWLARAPEHPGETTRFVDLAPTDKADASGVYSSALTEATCNPRVLNIALTGPYGSGKSSIIKSFLRSYKRPVLQISLAAFLPEVASPSSNVSKQEVERSILQQMLYGADANRLPLSRFRRIRSPSRWSIFSSLFMTIGALCFYYLIQNRESIIIGDYFLPFNTTNWFNISAFLATCMLLWLTIHHLYIASFGISLKSISLKDIELTPNSTTDASILNRHLDEIIYFFQSTKYELVVIEDLDRFNNPDIFVTLREINSLINANAGVKRTVRFLYALRDDMFVNTDRTKFFEFIVPVIPIINSSNSIDKVLEQGKRLSLDSRLSRQFLREVSRYLNDLRLIQNIFNEYVIYVANLETEGEVDLDANKLLAILIYKNVFPSDFENLHRDNGNLARIVRSHDRYIASSETRCTAEISRLEALVDEGERQLPNDLKELRRIYAMALIERIPAHYSEISLDHSNFITLSALPSSEQFENYLDAKQIFMRHLNGSSNPLPIEDFQSTVDPARNFQQRKIDIEKKSTAFREATAKTIRGLRSKLANLRMMKFNEIIRENSESLDELFEPFGESADLARYLVLEGYLDDTYYQYTSLFHSGRLSPSDNKFLIRIRALKNPAPDFQIDNPKEVIAAMRGEDFSRNFVLNVKIVDCLLSEPAPYAEQTKRLLAFISANFDACEQFLAIYYARGTEAATLIAELARTWPDFARVAMASSANLTHVARVISHLSSGPLEDLTRKNPTLSEFVSKRLPEVLALGIDFPPERLRLLGAEVEDLSAIEAYPGFIRVLFNEGLYKLSVENVDFVFRAVLSVEDRTGPREKNYTLMLEVGSAPLLAKVDENFKAYLDEVLLRLPDNRHESAAAIQRVIAHDGVDLESLVDFLKRQTTLLPTLDEIPASLYSTLFEIGRIEPTWENCLSFLGSESYDAKVLTDFLNTDVALAALEKCEIPAGISAAPLREFIFNNDGLNDHVYTAYVRALPNKFNEFPQEVSPEKLKILVEQNRVNFSPKNLSRVSEHVSLAVTFAKSHLAEYFEHESLCDLDDDFRERLLEADIDDKDRLKIINAMDLGALQALPSRAAIVGNIIDRTRALPDNLEADAARAIIMNSHPLNTQIALFNMLHEKFDEQQVREILQSLPEPLSDIKPGWTTPTLKTNEFTLEFVAWLKTRGFISSWRQGGLFDNDIRINLFRK